ncbi:MAG: hypothetical protein ACREMA_07675 [Longimicrobiales bacterium]
MLTLDVAQPVQIAANRMSALPRAPEHSSIAGIIASPPVSLVLDTMRCAWMDLLIERGRTY